MDKKPENLNLKLLKLESPKNFKISGSKSLSPKKQIQPIARIENNNPSLTQQVEKDINTENQTDQKKLSKKSFKTPKLGPSKSPKILLNPISISPMRKVKFSLQPQKKHNIPQQQNTDLPLKILNQQEFLNNLEEIKHFDIKNCKQLQKDIQIQKYNQIFDSIFSTNYINIKHDSEKLLSIILDRLQQWSKFYFQIQREQNESIIQKDQAIKELKENSKKQKDKIKEIEEELEDLCIENLEVEGIRQEIENLQLENSNMKYNFKSLQEQHYQQIQQINQNLCKQLENIEIICKEKEYGDNVKFKKQAFVDLLKLYESDKNTLLQNFYDIESRLVEQTQNIEEQINKNNKAINKFNEPLSKMWFQKKQIDKLYDMLDEIYDQISKKQEKLSLSQQYSGIPVQECMNLYIKDISKWLNQINSNSF